MASPGNRHCASCIGALLFPYAAFIRSRIVSGQCLCRSVDPSFSIQLANYVRRRLTGVRAASFECHACRVSAAYILNHVTSSHVLTPMR